MLARHLGSTTSEYLPSLLFCTLRRALNDSDLDEYCTDSGINMN
jgi:hypothetical protein